MNVADIEADLAKFFYELETENRLVRVGLKEKQESEKIYKKYKSLFLRENLGQIKSALKKTKTGKNKEILERIYFTIAASYIGLSTAKIADAVKTYFAKATVKVGGEKIAFFQLSPKIAKENIFEKREALDNLATAPVAKINPAQLELLKEEIWLFGTLGFKSYMDFFASAKAQDYAGFYKVVKKIVKDTNSIWDKTISKVSRDVLGRPFGKIRACHLVYLRSLSAFDSFYPLSKVSGTFIQFTKDTGLYDLLSNIKIDDNDRPKKNPRAVCYWPKPPTEIHLVIKPIGGEQDYEAMFHEGGHALHGAAIDPSLPYTFKTLSRSNALTECYAFVLESLVFEPTWLSSYLNVSVFSGEKIKWHAYFADIMMLRRYLGKFLYEYEMFSSGKIDNGPIFYASNLEKATGFVHKEVNWLSDMDSGFYSAEYLRAWIGASQIKDYLKRKFGDKWFLNKKAGAFLRKLYSDGVKYELEEVVKKLGYKPFDASYLVGGYKAILS